MIGCVPEHVMSGPANDETGQEALRHGLQHRAWKHVDPQLRPPRRIQKQECQKKKKKKKTYSDGFNIQEFKHIIKLAK